MKIDFFETKRYIMRVRCRRQKNPKNNPWRQEKDISKKWGAATEKSSPRKESLSDLDNKQ